MNNAKYWHVTSGFVPALICSNCMARNPYTATGCQSCFATFTWRMERPK